MRDFDRVLPGRFEMVRLEVTVAQLVVVEEPDLRALPRAHVERRRRRPQVVEQRIDAFEALGREEFLGVESAVGPPELDVTLVGKRSAAYV